MNTRANNRQVGGTHYQQQPYQHWDFVNDTKLPYMEAQIVKYVSRWRAKNGVQDLQKAIHFLDKLVEQHANIHFQEYPSHRREKVQAFCAANQLPELESQAVHAVSLWSSTSDLSFARRVLCNLIESEELAAQAGRAYVQQDPDGEPR